MTGLAFTADAIGVLVGLWYLFGSHKEGHLDYYLSTVAGARAWSWSPWRATSPHRC